MKKTGSKWKRSWVMLVGLGGGLGWCLGLSWGAGWRREGWWERVPVRALPAERRGCGFVALQTASSARLGNVLFAFASLAGFVFPIVASYSSDFH